MHTRQHSYSLFYTIAFLLFFVMPLFSHAVIPDSLDYQGYLTDSGGSPINGNVNVTFALYNVDTGGIALWSDTQSVDVSNGLFTVTLGGAGTPFPPGLFDDPLWLGINVGSDGEMTPRIEFSSAAFAHKADDALTLEGQSAASLDQSAHVSDTGNPHSVTAAQVGAITSAEFTLHISDPSVHHVKTTSFTELTDQASDAQLPDAVTRDTEIMPTVLAGDGAGSTLDADTLDGLDSADFMLATTDDWVNISGDTMSGNLNVLARVGIGTANPYSALDVRGSTTPNLARFHNYITTNDRTAGIVAESNVSSSTSGVASGGIFTGVGSPGGDAYGTQNLAAAYGSATAYGVYSDASGGPTTGREYAFYGLGDGYYSGKVSIGGIDNTHKLSVQDSSNYYLVFIENVNDTAAPATGINAIGNAYNSDIGFAQGGSFTGHGGHINGSARGSSHFAYAYGSANAYGVYSDASGGDTTGHEYAFFGLGDGVFTGNVGIGTALPTEKLVIQGDGSSREQGFISIKNSLEDAGIQLQNQSGIAYQIYYDSSTGIFRIHPGETSSAGISINQTGNVGIGTGTTPPIGSLNVAGGALFSDTGSFPGDNVAAAGFHAIGDATSGDARGSTHIAQANGTSTAIGVYSDATGGNTTGPEYAFYGIGDGHFSGNLNVDGTIQGSARGIPIYRRLIICDPALPMTLYPICQTTICTGGYYYCDGSCGSPLSVECDNTLLGYLMAP